jgi:3-hydroxyisobutyrate dehydrogenase-like beta-hydroxyacid dehydrogenase
MLLLGIGLHGLSRWRAACARPVTRCTPGTAPADKAQRLAAFGAQVHRPSGAGRRIAEVVVSMLEHGDAVADVLFEQGAAAAMKPGRAGDRHGLDQAARGARPCGAAGRLGGGPPGRPRLRRHDRCRSGTLAIMAGGQPADFERAQPVFAALFGRATHVGGHGTGQLAKLANQMIVGVTIGAVAEALLLCEKSGADPAKVKEAHGGRRLTAASCRMHGQRMVERDFRGPRAHVGAAQGPSQRAGQRPGCRDGGADHGAARATVQRGGRQWPGRT